MKRDTPFRVNCEFEFKGEKYLAWLSPYSEIGEEEKIIYEIREYSYLVHLFSLEGFKTFELFMDEDMQWATRSSSFTVDKSIVMILGYVLINAVS